MTIQLNRNPDDRILELGGGSNPMVRPTVMGGWDVNVDVRTCYNEQGQHTTDFTANFDEPLPIGDNDFDHVVCRYCLEHISWRKVRQFIGEIYRVLKPGGGVLIVTSNTAKQIEWVREHETGWDGKDLFESASCVLFGDQDYSDNTHKCYFTPAILRNLFELAGFTNVTTREYGARDTDLALTARKPTEVVMNQNTFEREAEEMRRVGFVGVKLSAPLTNSRSVYVDKASLREMPTSVTPPAMSREEMYDKHYFNGGGKVGGYAREGYRDFPVHEITFRHVMMRSPKSVLEIGAARGYIGKRLEDAGVEYLGLEVSKHCHMTRVCKPILLTDICNTPWGDVDPGYKFDLSFSIATLEHVPEDKVIPVLQELGRRCNRHLHGIDFGGHDDGFDKTHVCMHDKSWWEGKFREAGLSDFTVVDKEELERWHSGFPEDAVRGDGKLKLNVGSFTNMFTHGWINLDVHDLAGFAQHNHCRYLRHDCRQSLPFNTGDVDMIFAHHFLEHLNSQEALQFLKECRRLLKPASGQLRVVVPDAYYLMHLYVEQPNKLKEFAHINDGVENAKNHLDALNALLHSGHQSVFDQYNLSDLLEEAGFKCRTRNFRESQFSQMLRETTEMDFGGISLFMDAVPYTS